MTRLAYDQNINDESICREKRTNVGQLKGRAEFSGRHKGEETSNLLAYKYAMNYRDQGVSIKPNALDASFLSVDTSIVGETPKRHGLRGRPE